MRITVLEATRLLSGDPGPVLIAADGLCGWGAWMGDARPAAGDQVDVELGTGSQISWEQDVLVDFPPELPQDPAPGRMFVTGTVEPAAVQGVLTLRVDGGTVDFHLAEPAVPADIGSVVRLIARDVGIYPT